MKLNILHEQGHWEPVYGHPGWPKDSKYRRILKRSKKGKKGKKNASKRQNLSFRVDE